MLGVAATMTPAAHRGVLLAVHKSIASQRDECGNRFEASRHPVGRPRSVDEATVGRAIALLEAGRSWRQIGAELDVPVSTIRRSVQQLQNSQ